MQSKTDYLLLKAELRKHVKYFNLLVLFHALPPIREQGEREFISSSTSLVGCLCCLVDVISHFLVFESCDFIAGFKEMVSGSAPGRADRLFRAASLI